MSTRLQLSEREAWRWLETKLRRGLKGHHNGRRITNGLCWEIEEMGRRGQIASVTEDRMMGKLYEADPFRDEDATDRPDEDLYYWPRTPEGDKERALFCAKQVSELGVSLRPDPRDV